MIELKDFISKGYKSRQISDSMLLLSKKVKKDYVIKIIVDVKDEYIEPFIELDTSPVGTICVAIDNRTSIEDIEEFFSTVYNAVSKFRKESNG